MARTPPKIEMLQPEPGFARFLAHGFDAWKVSLNAVIPQVMWDRLDGAKRRAIDLDEREKTPVAFSFGGLDFQMEPYASKGWKYLIKNDDYSVQFASPNREWALSIECRSAGLWEHGREALMDQIYEALEKEGIIPNDDDSERLSRLDYCFDILSSDFTLEMRTGIQGQCISPSKSKTGTYGWCNSDQMETLYIGQGGACQVRIYDKSKEIVQASGKHWMYGLWGLEEGTPNVWRVEVQLTKDWLKDRNCNRPGDFLDNKRELICDAIMNRRLTRPSISDSNRRRWPLHPLMTLCMNSIGTVAEFKPIGRKVTGKREVIEKRMEKGIAGTLRSLLVLAEGEGFTEDEIRERALQAVNVALMDQEDGLKRYRAKERYAFIDEAE